MWKTQRLTKMRNENSGCFLTDYGFHMEKIRCGYLLYHHMLLIVYHYSVHCYIFSNNFIPFMVGFLYFLYMPTYILYILIPICILSSHHAFSGGYLGGNKNEHLFECIS